MELSSYGAELLWSKAPMELCSHVEIVTAILAVKEVFWCLREL